VEVELDERTTDDCFAQNGTSNPAGGLAVLHTVDGSSGVIVIKVQNGNVTPSSKLVVPQVKSFCYVQITVPQGKMVGVKPVAQLKEREVIYMSDACMDSCSVGDVDYVDIYSPQYNKRQYISRSNRVWVRLTFVQDVHYEVRMQFSSIEPGQWILRETGQHSGLDILRQ
jgi:hypothetical protein